MTRPIPARRIPPAEIRVRAALADDFDARRDLRPFLEFATSRTFYADAVTELLKTIFPGPWTGKFSVIPELIDPWLADDLRLVRIAKLFHLVPFEKYFERFELADLKAATRKPRKLAHAWAALAVLGFVRGPNGTLIQFDPEKPSLWPKREAERAAVLLRLIALRVFPLTSERGQ